MAATICSAIPVPAEPAPTITTFWSTSSRLDCRSADRTAASATVAVPWMSSLNEQSRSR